MEGDLKKEHAGTIYYSPQGKNCRWSIEQELEEDSGSNVSSF